MRQPTFNVIYLRIALLAFLTVCCWEGSLQAKSNEGAVCVCPMATKEYVRAVKKEFPIGKEGLVKLNNQHGQVEVVAWERDRVRIDVKITVYADTKTAAEEVFTRVHIDFGNRPEEVSALTRLEQKESWWGWIWNTSKDQYSIDYKVFVPNGCNLAVKHKHGDVQIAALDGAADITMEHGNLSIDRIGKNLLLDLSYTNADVQQAESADVLVHFSQLRFKETKNLRLTSSYSKIFIERATDIDCQSTYDTYEVGAVGHFINQGKYDNIAIDYADKVQVKSKITDVRVDKIGNSADLDLYYGEASILSVSKNFSELVLIGNYVDFRVNVESGTSYRLNATSVEAGLQYPDELIILSRKGQKNNEDIQGINGTATNPKSSINVKVSNGGCIIDKGV